MLVKHTYNSRTVRRCLKCDRSFLSKHRFNRLCENCAKQNAGVSFGQYVLHTGASPLRPLEERE
jgi:Zn finger protein HypA/HybF involved in hydrogenase expression